MVYVFLYLSALSLAQARLVQLDGPKPLWTANIPPSGMGNECEICEMDSLLICTGVDGSTTAVMPDADGSVGGTVVWNHVPTTISISGTPTFSTSGITFGSNPTIGSYIIHAVSEGLPGTDPTFCVVYALDPVNGEAIWRSQDLEGACSGTPVVSNDGNFIFLTHNLVSVGHFTVLGANQNGIGFYSQLDPDQPYGPPGIYHMPVEGYYSEGSGNSNDIVVWAYRPKPGEEAVGNGRTFVFQFPIDFSGDASVGLAVAPLSNVAWKVSSAPQIFNNGYSMVFGVSRAEFHSWNGGPGDQRNSFDRGATNTATGFTRGEPSSQASFSSLALNSNPLEPMMFGGTGGPQFVGFDSVLNRKWVINTTVAAIAKAQVSPDDQIVYCLEPNGSVHSIEADTGLVRWTAILEGAHLADFAQSKNGKYLYFNNQAGTLTAWQVTDDVPSPPQPSGNPAPISTMPVVDTPAPNMFCGLRNDLCLMNADCCSNSCQPQPGEVAGVCVTAKTANKNAQKLGAGMGGAGNQGKRD